MKYVIYLRVSTGQQAISGLGLEAQRELCLKKVPKGADVLEFADEGLSGTLDFEKRPALLSAVNCLQKGDIMLIAKRDRIGRDPGVNALIEKAVLRRKATILSASGDFDNNNDPTSILMKRMVDVFAEYECKIIGARTKAALQIKKKNNQRVGHIPYGFQLAEDKIHLLPNEKENENLSLMRQLRGQDYSLRRIAHKLNELKKFNRNGIWNHSAVKRVMK